MIKYFSYFCLACVLVACGHKVKPADDVRYVKIFTVGSSQDSELTTFHGVVHAEFEPNLAFRVGGKIISREVDIGQAVKAGVVLASLDPTDYRLSADSAKAQLAAAKSNYVTQKANLARYHELLLQNFVSQAQFDSQQAQFDSAKAQYQQATNQLSNNQNQVQYTSLKATNDGVITAVKIEVGQVVSSGQVVFSMAMSGNKEVEIELPEAQINNYKVGMSAQIKIWATDNIYQGVIRSINQASDQQTRTFTARVAINKADADIKYGMAADVSLVPLNTTNGTELPLSSLYARDGKTYVWVMDKNSQAQLMPVVVISTDGAFMKIKQGALANGVRVIRAGTNLLYIGQKLAVYVD